MVHTRFTKQNKKNLLKSKENKTQSPSLSLDLRSKKPLAFSTRDLWPFLPDQKNKQELLQEKPVVKLDKIGKIKGLNLMRIL